ncbi:hypothetical protein FEK43_00310 [Escherichia sp. E2562]|nr:hypothetical protein FEK43_00310 [Escherichia sp. E2562]
MINQVSVYRHPRVLSGC